MSIHYCMCSCRLMPGQCNYSPEIGISKEAYCVSLYPEWTNSFHLSIIGWYHGQMGNSSNNTDVKATELRCVFCSLIFSSLYHTCHSSSITQIIDGKYTYFALISCLFLAMNFEFFCQKIRQTEWRSALLG